MTQSALGRVAPVSVPTASPSTERLRPRFEAPKNDSSIATIAADHVEAWLSRFALQNEQGHEESKSFTGHSDGLALALTRIFRAKAATSEGLCSPKDGQLYYLIRITVDANDPHRFFVRLVSRQPPAIGFVGPDNDL